MSSGLVIFRLAIFLPGQQMEDVPIAGAYRGEMCSYRVSWHARNVPNVPRPSH
jgi:hypothetical protein